jgi:hypothetical protein
MEKKPNKCMINQKTKKNPCKIILNANIYKKIYKLFKNSSIFFQTYANIELILHLLSSCSGAPPPTQGNGKG